jgi:hypothetical protein
MKNFRNKNLTTRAGIKRGKAEARLQAMKDIQADPSMHGWLIPMEKTIRSMSNVQPLSIN